MSCLVWNCRGLGNPAAVRNLVWLIKHKSPTLVFLMETKLLALDWKLLLSNLNYDAHFIVNCDMTDGGGRKGGLCLLWKEVFEVRILSSSLHHINASISDQLHNLNWRFCGIYGWPEQVNKGYTWQLLRDMKEEGGNNWVCAGDFNEILFGFEKSGGVMRDSRKMNDFRLAIQDCGLEDIGYKGHRFTWTNNQSGNQNIEERLDRFLASTKWIQTFLDYKVEHLLRKSSDHCPILLDFKPKSASFGKKRNFFKLEAMWFKDDSCKKTCEMAWKGQSITSPKEFQDRIISCGISLKDWETDHFGNISKLLSNCRKELGALEVVVSTQKVTEDRKKLELKIDDLLEKEEIMWKQRSKALWLQDGDKNSAYFHKVANGRKRRNQIVKILDSDGLLRTSPDDIEVVFRHFFQDLFKTQGDQDMEEVLNAIETCVTPEMNELLLKPYTSMEIGEALSQMHPLKSPGPDGMPALFFQKCWDFIKHDISSIILNILNHGDSPSALNSTHICLIPKKKNPITPTDFRPISLCNVSYKIISKVITNRLKKILPDIVHINQSAFVPGRQITDNALLAFELFHMMKNSKAQKRGNFAFKLDMAKAYDRVEWNFLSATMSCMGFHKNFVNLVMRCTSSVSFSILINGFPGRHFTPSRGLRQGDPLSPYLFLFCADALSALLRKAETNHLLHGARICREAPSVSHLFFADDSLIFGRASEDEIDTVKRILQIYEVASGQKVNLDKSDISFSGSLPNDLKDNLAHRLGVRRVEKHGLYLGIPSSIGKNKKEIFQMLEDRVRKKIKDWKRRFLSAAGKTTLIKSVVQAIPTYIMSCFLLPEQLCQRLNSISANFFWSQKEDCKRIHWRNWNALCSNKLDGGLGFRDISCFNRALLAKQAWRLLQNGNSLLGQSLRAKYYPRVSPLRAVHAHNPSYSWRSIMAGFEVIQLGAIWRVGNGNSIRIGLDNWVPDACNFRVGLNLRAEDAIKPVSDFINHLEGEWDIDALKNVFLPSDVDLILAIPIKKFCSRDFLRWHFTSSGFYTVKSGYFIAQKKKALAADVPASSADLRHIWKWVWKLRVIPKVQLLLWRCITDSLPSKVNLVRRSLVVDPRCSRCGEGFESLEHIFRDCPWSKLFWRSSSLRLDVTNDEMMPFLQWLEKISKVDSSEFHELFATLIWTVWFARNTLIFQGQFLSHLQCFDLAGRNRKFCLDRSRSTHSVVNEEAWVRPRAGVWKINVDAAVKKGVGTGLGVVIRDESSRIHWCHYRFLHHGFPVEVAEALAAREGLMIASSYEDRKLILETDCQSLFSRLQCSATDLSYLSSIVDDIKSFASRFVCVEYSWVRRSANSVAHQLAQFGLSSCNSVGFTGPLPDCILLPFSEKFLFV